MAGVVFFDIDGTLTSAAVTSSAGYLAALTGNADRVESAEAAYARGEVSNHDVCIVDAAGLAGVAVEQVAAWLDDLPLVDGVAEVVDHCLARGLHPVLASLAWSPVSTSLAQRFGFTTSGGPELEAVDGVFTGRVRRSFDEVDKRDCALSVAQRLGVSPDRCLAVGDSRSDLPLFAAVGAAVAVNASPACAAAAQRSLVTSDPRDVIPLLDELLPARAPR